MDGSIESSADGEVEGECRGIEGRQWCGVSAWEREWNGSQGSDGGAVDNIRAFKGELRECKGGVDSRVGEMISFGVGCNGAFIVVNEGVANERVLEAIEGVAVMHHACWVVDKGEVVSKELLGNAADLVNVSSVVEQLLHGVAVTEPIEVGAP